ncbi:hypothetical protein OHA21_37555 [Actinoplanes sp. NBC_00393]|uniref:hypothetical protein n=1 Tax=Actinoplanes sp. NBC_00393 TaxID=2975953 RepID=UPI002E2055F9
MTSVRARFAAALIALIPAAGLLAAGSPAQAATDITVKSVSVSKPAFVLSAKAGCKTSVTFTAVISGPLPTTGYEYAGVGVDLNAPGGANVDGVEFKRVGSTTTYKGSLKLCGKYAPGKYTAEIYGALLPVGGEFEFTNVVKKSITIKRPSKLTLNAAPEPVAKGKKLTAKGTLKIDGKALSGAKVKVYFKATGATAWTYKGTAVTTGTGAYSKKFTATKTGTWKAIYEGTGKRNYAAATDAVKVK